MDHANEASQAADGPGDGLPQPARNRAMLVIILGIGMAVLDGSIVNLALPGIARELNASAAHAIWVVNAYQIATLVMLLPLAALGERLGYRRVYFAGMALFAVSSVGGMLADSLAALIVARALQGLGAAELSYQGALPYAKERLSMRSLSGKKFPDKVADPLIVHGDVRRMLLTQKAFAEGGRAMIYYAAKFTDHLIFGKTQEEKDEADDQLGFLTPILKAFLTETGLEAANLGMQVYGGHGYIKEWGMEQIVRDTRIATLYEGTTGIQALDLLGRKVLLGKMKTLKAFSFEVLKFCKDKGLISNNPHKKEMNKFIWPLVKYTTNWQQYSVRLALRARKNFDVVGCASVDYLMYSGYVSMAYFWAMMAQTAYEKLAAGTDQPEFYKAKIQTAEFYFDRLLPRAKAHAECMMASPKSLMKMKEENFSFLQ